MSEEDSREKIHKMMENIYTVPVQYRYVNQKNLLRFKETLELISTRDKSISPPSIFEQVNPAGDSLLHTAAMFGSEEITEYIASEYPALLTKTNIKGDTALHIAVRGNKSGIIKTIVHNYTKQSRDKNLLEIQNALGNTALHEAVIINGHLLNTEDALFLLDEHPEVAHCLNNGNKSPLYLAVQNGSRKLVEAMLKKAMLPGKGKSLPNCTGVSPIHAAILESRRTSRTDMLELILHHGEQELIYLKDEEGNTPLHCAASNGDFSAVVELLKYSGSVTLDSGNMSELGIYKFGRITLERNNNGQLPVHIACHRGHVEIVNLLLKWWPGPEKMLNKEGQSILHVAAESGKENVVNYILSDARLKDSLVAETDNNGNTPLHLAAKGLHARILFSLTRKHRKTNYVKLRNNEGYTARDFVSVNESAPMLRKIVSTVILYSAGASHSRKGKIGRSPPKEAPSVDLIKSRIETLMLIAILVATVTFAAGFTVPGGLNGSDEPDPEKRGMATLVHRRMFQAFTICNTIAMYSSILSSFVFLWAQLGDLHLAVNAYKLALTLVGVALATMSVAFMAAVDLVVGNLRWLEYIVMIIATFFLITFFLLYTLYTYPYRASLPLLQYISDHVIKVLLLPISGGHTAAWLEDGQFNSEYYSDGES